MGYKILKEYKDTALSVDFSEWQKMVSDQSRKEKMSNFYYKKEFFRLSRVVKTAIKEGKIIET